MAPCQDAKHTKCVELNEDGPAIISMHKVRHGGGEYLSATLMEETWHASCFCMLLLLCYIVVFGLGSLVPALHVLTAMREDHPHKFSLVQSFGEQLVVRWVKGQGVDKSVPRQTWSACFLLSLPLEWLTGQCSGFSVVTALCCRYCVVRQSASNLGNKLFNFQVW